MGLATYTCVHTYRGPFSLTTTRDKTPSLVPRNTHSLESYLTVENNAEEWN